MAERMIQMEIDGKDGVHFFRETGYEHYPCPQGDMWERGRCSCDEERNFGMWQDTVVARSDGFADISLFRLPRRVVLLAKVGAGSQPTSRTVR